MNLVLLSLPVSFNDCPHALHKHPTGKLHQQNSGLKIQILHQNDYSFQVTKGMKKGEVLQDTSDPLYNPNIGDLMDLKEGIKLAKQDYDEALNFSSEIEYDERFD